MSPDTLIIADLHELLDYNPESGCITWKTGLRTGIDAGSRRQDGYIKLCLRRKQYLGHRVAWAMHYGRWPEYQIDHINGNPRDNRISNLREATNRQNSLNRGRYKSNTSGHVGVARSGNRWRAYICSGGRQRHLGCFGDRKSASAAYESYAQKIFNEFKRKHE